MSSRRTGLWDLGLVVYLTEWVSVWGIFIKIAVHNFYFAYQKASAPTFLCGSMSQRTLHFLFFLLFWLWFFCSLSLSLDICIYLFKRRIILPVASGSRRTYLRPRLRPIEAAVAKANEPAACGISAKWTRPRWPKITTTRARLEYIYCMAFGAACWGWKCIAWGTWQTSRLHGFLCGQERLMAPVFADSSCSGSWSGSCSLQRRRTRIMASQWRQSGAYVISQNGQRLLAADSCSILSLKLVSYYWIWCEE